MSWCCAGHKKRNSIKWVIDVTIGYPEQTLDLFDIISASRPPCQVSVHYRRYRADSVPCDHDALLRWLYDRWAEKDQLLDHFYKTGSFPSSPADPPAGRLLAVSDARCIVINTFLVISAWFAVRTIYVVSCFMVDLVFG